jgi:uncharacterized protein (DUF433 family)
MADNLLRLTEAKMDFNNELDFLAPNDIRVRGTRMGIESILHEYLQGQTPVQIVRKYPTLTLAQVHTTIAYYLENKTLVDTYLSRWQRAAQLARVRQSRSPSVGIARLHALKHGSSPGTNGHK